MFSNPIKNLKQLGLRENMIVADLGAGTGFYTIPAGHIVTSGKVYAVEVVQDMLTTIRNKVKDARLENVDCIWGDIEKLGGTKIADGVIDAVIASNILFQVERKEKFIEEAKRILKKGGKVLFIDWMHESHAGPDKAHCIPKEKALSMFQSVGFTLEREIDAGTDHYGMILIRQS